METSIVGQSELNRPLFLFLFPFMLVPMPVPRTASLALLPLLNVICCAMCTMKSNMKHITFNLFSVEPEIHEAQENCPVQFFHTVNLPCLQKNSNKGEGRRVSMKFNRSHVGRHKEAYVGNWKIIGK